MKAKLQLAILALALLPGAAFAQCSHSQDIVMSCADGTQYDPETQSCVPISTS